MKLHLVSMLLLAGWLSHLPAQDLQKLTINHSTGFAIPVDIIKDGNGDRFLAFTNIRNEAYITRIDSNDNVLFCKKYNFVNNGSGYFKIRKIILTYTGIVALLASGPDLVIAFINKQYGTIMLGKRIYGFSGNVNILCYGMSPAPTSGLNYYKGFYLTIDIKNNRVTNYEITKPGQPYSLLIPTTIIRTSSGTEPLNIGGLHSDHNDGNWEDRSGFYISTDNNHQYHSYNIVYESGNLRDIGFGSFDDALFITGQNRDISPGHHGACFISRSNLQAPSSFDFIKGFGNSDFTLYTNSLSKTETMNPFIFGSSVTNNPDVSGYIYRSFSWLSGEVSKDRFYNLSSTAYYDGEMYIGGYPGAYYTSRNEMGDDEIYAAAHAPGGGTGNWTLNKFYSWKSGKNSCFSAPAFRERSDDLAITEETGFTIQLAQAPVIENISISSEDWGTVITENLCNGIAPVTVQTARRQIEK